MDVSSDRSPCPPGGAGFCSSCGQPLQAHCHFCEHCGQPISVAPPEGALASADSSAVGPSPAVSSGVGRAPGGRRLLLGLGVLAVCLAGVALNLTYCQNIFHWLPQAGEDFSRFPSGWRRSPGAKAASVIIESGRLLIASGSGVLFDPPLAEQVAFSLDLKFQGGSGTAGIRVRDADEANYHEILIRNDGAIALVEVDGNQLKFIEPWTAIPGWRGSDQDNQVRVINYAPNGPLVVYVNGAPLVSATSTNPRALAGNRMGLWAYSKDSADTFRASFDHLHFWTIS